MAMADDLRKTQPQVEEETSCSREGENRFKNVSVDHSADAGRSV